MITYIDDIFPYVHENLEYLSEFSESALKDWLNANESEWKPVDTYIRDGIFIVDEEKVTREQYVRQLEINREIGAVYEALTLKRTDNH